MRNKEGRKVTYRFVNFRYMERGAFAEYLHRMALKGWHFRGWKWGMVFEQGEPEDVVYDVEIFSEAREKDLCPEEETEEYAEYCRAAGWEFVDANRKFCVFRKVSEYAVPIVTETERVEEIWKAEGKRMLIPAIIFGIFAVDYPVTAVKTGIENWLFSDLHLFILFLFPAYFLGYVLQYIFTLKWYLTGKKRISSGKTVRYGLRIGYRIWNGFVNIALAVLIVWVYYLGLHKIAVIALIAVLFFDCRLPRTISGQKEKTEERSGESAGAVTLCSVCSLSSFCRRILLITNRIRAYWAAWRKAVLYCRKKQGTKMCSFPTICTRQIIHGLRMWYGLHRKEKMRIWAGRRKGIFAFTGRLDREPSAVKMRFWCCSTNPMS